MNAISEIPISLTPILKLINMFLISYFGSIYVLKFKFSNLPSEKFRCILLTDNRRAKLEDLVENIFQLAWTFHLTLTFDDKNVKILSMAFAVHEQAKSERTEQV